MEEKDTEEQTGYGEKDIVPVVEGDHYSIEEVVKSFVEGDPVFQSFGTARVKVGDRVLQIPVKSVDMEGIVKALSHKKPKAPTERKCIKANSDEGRKAGLSRDRWVEVSVESDEGYQQRMQEYNTELGYLVLLEGINIEIKNREGRVVWEPGNKTRQESEEALRVLRGMGLTGWQFSQLTEAISDLTRFQEEAVEKNSEEE
jgi:hypothetical protein